MARGKSVRLLATPTPARGAEKKSRVTVARGKDGRFLQGNQAAALRRPDDLEVKEWAQQTTPEAREFMLATMRNPKAPYRLRVYCAKWIVERGYGKVPHALAAPLVNIDMRGPGPTAGAQLPAAEAYRWMLTGHIEPDPRHPAFRPAIEAQPGEVSQAPAESEEPAQ